MLNVSTDKSRRGVFIYTEMTVSFSLRYIILKIPCHFLFS